MAEFRAHYDEFRAVGADLAGLSVDEAGNSEPVRQLYQLQFPILCDTKAEVVQSWGLYNGAEKGGISQSAVFIIEPGLKVRYRSLDSTVSRVRAAELLEYLQASAAGARPAAPERRVVIPTVGEIARTAWPSTKLSLFPPKR